jgi:ABC-type branched-subunit amino acid transport system substrate-binding protein
VELARYAVQDWGKKRVCVFYVNDAYGKGLAEIFQSEIVRLGATVVTSRMHRNVLSDDDKQMLSSSLAALKGAEPPDLFVLFQRLGAADWSISAIRQAGFHGDILGGDNLGQSIFMTTNPEIKEGIRVSEFYLPSPDSSVSVKFANSLRQMTGSDADYGQAFAYDAVYLVRDACAKYGFTRDAVKRYLDELISERAVQKGAGGDYLLAPDHDARRTMYIVEGHNGRYEQLKALTP